MKPATNSVRGRSYTSSGGSSCSIAVIHDRDAIGHRERLLLIVSHVDERDSDLPLDALQLHLEAFAQLQVERPEQLVEQQHGGLVDERTSQRHALLLAAGRLPRLALRLGGEPDALQLLAHAAAHLVLGHALPAQPEGDVVLGPLR